MAKITAARQVMTAGPGFHGGGVSNLYLRVRESGSRSWVFRWRHLGKPTDLGLGSPPDRGLGDARELAGQMRAAIVKGQHPATVLEAERPVVEEVSKTFRVYADEVVEAKKLGFKNAKHKAQWASTLKAYAYPTIGDKRPGEVTIGDLKTILEPLWATKTETASRLRGRIEAVIDYAAVIEGDDRRNPARWRGNLDKLFQAPRKVRSVKHHPAAPYAEVPTIMKALRQRPTMSAYVLRFSILTAARSTEARDARWCEIDTDGAIWTVPKERMKANRPHVVPLSAEALQVLELAKALKRPDSDRVFPGPQGGLISDVAINKTLKSIRPGVTAHGFRSSFREWGAECTGFQAGVLEAALAHTDANKVQAAYQRSNLLGLRRQIMKDWAEYLLT